MSKRTKEQEIARLLGAHARYANGWEPFQGKWRSPKGVLRTFSEMLTAIDWHARSTTKKILAVAYDEQAS